MSTDSKRDVESWLAKEGYPLEMRCASKFEEAGFGISLGEYYTDPFENKSREIDIIATIIKDDRFAIGKDGLTSNLCITLRIIAECKSSIGRPWIVFKPTSPFSSTVQNYTSEPTNPSNYLINNLNFIDGLPVGGFFLGSEFTGYGGVTSYPNCKKKGEDLLYSGCSGVSSAVRAIKNYPTGLLFQMVSQVVNISVPIVILEGELFSAQLVDESIEVTSCTTARMNWKGGGHGGTILDIVPVDALPTYLTSISKEIDILMQACHGNPSILEESIGLKRLTDSLLKAVPLSQLETTKEANVDF